MYNIALWLSLIWDVRILHAFVYIHMYSTAKSWFDICTRMPVELFEKFHEIVMSNVHTLHYLL